MGIFRKVVRWVWTSPCIVFFRKCINTFRGAAWLLGKLQCEPVRRQEDAFAWNGAGGYKAEFYATLDEDAAVLIDCVTAAARRNESILDICCNQGRFLLELRRKGFTDLHGFDIMGPAIEALRQSPDYDSKYIRVGHCLAQDYFKDKSDNCFDWAITHGATIELIHPAFDIFGELRRTIRKGMILVLDEKGQSYPRFYRLLHRMNGFEIVATRKLHLGKLNLIHSVKR